MKKRSPFIVLIAVLAFGCGDTLPPAPPATPFGPPSGLKSFSVNQSSVSIQWLGLADSTVQGYIAQVGTRRDTLSKSTLAFLSTGLLPGESAFSIYALRNDGAQSNPATIQWAPAARFDSAYTLYESNTLVSIRPEGFDVGTSTTNPSAIVMDPTDPEVQQTMDFYIYGGSQQIQQPLAMWSAHHYIGTFNHTSFSTQTDASPSLDYPLATFPAETTFTKDTIAVADNMIYYAKVVGDPQQFNYARIHIRYRLGSAFPDRILDVRVSLQRVPGLQFAYVPRDNSGELLQNPKLCLFVHNHS